MRLAVGLLLMIVEVVLYCALPVLADPYGYVESNLRSAERLVMMDALTRRQGQSLPSDYVEYAIKLDLPNGSPIPGIQGTHPDLELKAQNRQADSVDHLSFGTESMIYFAELKMGQTYDVFLRGSGNVNSGLASIATIRVQPSSPRQQAIKIIYRQATKANPTSMPMPTTGATGQARVTSDRNWQAPTSGQDWRSPTSDQGWHAPAVDQSWHSPSIGPGYQSPGSR